MATIVKYFGSTNSFSVSGASGLVQVVGSGVDNGFTVPQTFSGTINQAPGSGANNQSPFLQTGDMFSDYMAAFTAPATSSTLSSTLPAATVYVLGQRVVIPDTAFTVTASVTSYLDLSNTGVLTVSTSATVTANSLRLWSVVSSSTAITGVTQVALTAPASKASIIFIGTNGGPNGGASVGLTLATSTTGGTIAASTAYYYLVTPVYAAGPDFMPNESAPGYGITTGSTTATNSNAISWSAVTGAISYNINRASSNAALDFAYIGNTTNLSFTDTGLSAGAATTGIETTAFANIPLSAISVDTQNGWSVSQQGYIIPVTGVWEVVTLLAYADDQTTGISYSADSNSSVADSPFNIWGTTPTVASGQSQRNGLLNTKKQHFNAGDVVQPITYAGAPMWLKAATISLVFVGQEA